MRAVVTGAAGGIGRAIARRLAVVGADARLLVVDVAAAALEQTAGEARAAGASVATFACDLSSPAAGEEVADEAARTLGGIDALVSNAGVLQRGRLGALSLEEYETTTAVNARATWLLAKAAYPHLKESRGCLIATASVAADHPTPGLGAYSVSKAAVVMVVKQLAYEWGPDGIRCNCVSPGAIHTPMTDAAYADSDLRVRRATHIPLRRVGIPDDVAAVVEFLVSPAAAYVTGVNVAVDGGLSTTLMRPNPD
jgi:glucose 1-dehydrogenase